MFQIKRRHNKWIACFMVSVFMMLSLFGCGKDKESSRPQANKEEAAFSQKELNIVAANFPCYDFARAITGGKAEITMLIPPGNEVHSYEPTPQDMIKVGNCDLFIYTGGESDVYIEEILKSFPNKQFKVIKMMDFVELYEEETIEGMQVRGHSHDHGSHEPAYVDEDAHVHGREEESTVHEEEHGTEAGDAHEEEHGTEAGDVHEEEHGTEAGDVHEEEHETEDGHVHEVEYDEHVWTSPRNAIKIIEGITEAICKLDSDNATFYRDNAKCYTEQIDALDKQFTELFGEHKGEAVFVGDRFPFLYFAKEYGLTYYAVFPSCNGESEPSAKTMAFFIEKAKSSQAKTIFYLELSNNQTAEVTAEAIGAKVEELHSCHNVTKEDFKKGVTYVELMERNYQKLREAF